ncbi:hypothetical protein A5885_000357, partial [Enterococcus sp. 8E11_MSG4843]
MMQQLCSEELTNYYKNKNPPYIVGRMYIHL